MTLGCCVAAGFGAIARHLGRLTESVTTALELDDLRRDSMALLQPHSPAISITAAMQQTMGTRACEWPWRPAAGAFLHLC